MPDQQPLEMILLRQLAAYLAVPLWLMDKAGNLVFYNGPAEKLLGIQFDEAGPIRAEELLEMFKVSSLEGEPLSGAELPVLVALNDRVPSHSRIQFRGFDGLWREVEVSAIPVQGQGERFMGVFVAFWEVDR